LPGIIGNPPIYLTMKEVLLIGSLDDAADMGFEGMYCQHRPDAVAEDGSRR
jgi:hypothetical protein